MATALGVDALVEAIRTGLPDVRLLTDPLDREAYRLDETAYLTAGLPGAIALPATTADVSALLHLARLIASRWSRAAPARACPAARRGSRAPSRSP